MLKLFLLSLLFPTLAISTPTTPTSTSPSLHSNSGIYSSNGTVVYSTSDSTPQNYVRSINEDRSISNSERLKRGLPLLKPTRRRRFAAIPRASCAPLTNTQGNIEVLDSTTSTTLGYISNTYDSQNSYTYSTLANAAVFSVLSSSPYDSAIDITAINGPDASYPLLGGVGGSAGYNFRTGNLGYAYLSGVGQTNANSPPSSAGHSINKLGYNRPSESQIWTMTCGGELTAQWTNTDGSQPSTSVFYDRMVDYVGLIGDFAIYTATFPNAGAVLVTLRFVPI